MSTLAITRGLPGSGKTTHARIWVAEDPDNRARVNRDDLRARLGYPRIGNADQERRVTVVQHDTCGALLRAGMDVVCDDTNLRDKYVRALRVLAVTNGATFDVWDMTDVPLETCIKRDAGRLERQRVGEQVIRDMHQRFVAGRKYPLPWPTLPTEAPDTIVPYVAPTGAPAAVIVDVDGTVALMAGRSPYDETKVGEDLPNAPVITAVRAMHAAGHRVIFCSGRTDACRAATEAWLAEHVGVPYEALHMRKTGDQRKDSVVKGELFDRHIRHAYRVVAVFDDRAQVVAHWRALGLTVFAVADGQF